MNNNVQETFDKGAKNLLEYSIEMAMLQRTRAVGILTERQGDEVERSIKNTIMQNFALVPEIMLCAALMESENLCIPMMQSSRVPIMQTTQV